MEIRHLRYFLTLAETLHFGRAAQREYITQSSFSQHVARLEREIGVHLFERSSNRVRLTIAGEAFVPRAQEMLRQLGEAEEEARQIAAGAAGTLRVGIFPSAGGELTPLIFGAYREAFPSVTLQFVEVNMTTQVEALANRTVDVAVLYMPVSDRRVEVSLLFAEPRWAALPRHHPLADADAVSVGELAHEHFVICVAPQCWSSFWRCDDDHGEGGSAPVSVATVTEGLSAIATLGVVDTVPATGTRGFQHPGVAYVPMRDGAYASAGIASRAGEDRPLVRGFVDVAERVAAQHRGLVPFAVAPADAPPGTPGTPVPA
jgi:DNA-binding transcriptional LysR family regulator